MSQSSADPRKRQLLLQWGPLLLLIAMAGSPRASHADSSENTSNQDIGIHVGPPKVYDTRELTLIQDQLAQELRTRGSFIDPKALATALGNVQGFQESQFSQSFLANGAVGPGAATVFANAATGGNPAASALAAAPGAVTAATTPTITINLTPTLNAGATSTTPATTPAASTAMPLGPQPPALPTLPTAPSYTPTFGLNASDLLSDEVNLTYQLSNIRLLLDRSLSDRLFYVPQDKEHPTKGHYVSRLQAVVGFDIDLEPDYRALDAVARVDVKVTLPNELPECAPGNLPSLVALMPEEGSHNAATLSQKANAFGGAIAASVFSIGYQAQSGSEVFYLYRDMDTLSFQNPQNGTALEFGWQFRPVLGRRSVDPGLRHMIAVLGLPCPDDNIVPPKLNVTVETAWLPYDASSQTTKAKPHWWSTTPLPHGKPQEFARIEVPPTDTSQGSLAPSIDSVTWIPTDVANGVARVSGKNFFPGTLVRMGAKTFGSSADGLTLKSDHEFEVAMPLGVAVVGGVVSGRYGNAIPLQPADSSTDNEPAFTIRSLHIQEEGSSMVQLTADLRFDCKSGTEPEIHARNLPVLLVNGAPVVSFESPTVSPGTNVLEKARIHDKPCEGIYIDHTLTAFVPVKALAEGPTIFTVVFPFAGTRWVSSLPYYAPTVKVVRLGGENDTRLLISATDAADQLCRGWRLELDAVHTFPPEAPRDKNAQPEKHAPAGRLSCADPIHNELSLEVPTKELKPYHHFLLVSTTDAARVPLVGDIPPAEPPPAGPKLEMVDGKDQVVTVSQFTVKPITFKGKNLDQVKKVLFGSTSLDFTPSDDGTKILINLLKDVTSEAPREVGLELLSPGNDPQVAVLQVTKQSAPASPPPPKQKEK